MAALNAATSSLESAPYTRSSRYAATTPIRPETSRGQSWRTSATALRWKSRRNERTVSRAGVRTGSARRATRSAHTNPGTPTVMNATRQPYSDSSRPPRSSPRTPPSETPEARMPIAIARPGPGK